MSPDYLTATFARLVRASGLPSVRMHDLRHGAASLALTPGTELKVIADQFGHCSIVLTTAASPRRRIRASTEQTPNHIGLDH
jgi:integrase